MKKIWLFIPAFVLVAGVVFIANSNNLKMDNTNNNSEQNNGERKVRIETTKGNITIKLYNGTPKHRDNFIKLVTESFYNGVIFHRVIKGFMIQTGDPNSKNPKPGASYGTGGPGYTIPAEFNSAYIHKKGALAAARLGDNVNPKKESSGSQFYIVQGRKYSEPEINQLISAYGKSYTPQQKEIYKTIGGTPFLDADYTVFGEVTEGLDIVDAIANSKTLPGDRPAEDIIIKSMKMLN